MTEPKKQRGERGLNEEIHNLQSTVIELQATVISLLRQRIDCGEQEAERAERGAGSGSSDEVKTIDGVHHPDWGGDLVPVFRAEIGGYEQLACNARTLHEFLEVKRDFSNWIKGRIAKYEFVENDDFIVTENLSSPNLASSKARQQRLIDYHLTLGMAKELAMVENNPNGRRVRRYFIDCERKLLDGVQRSPVEPDRGTSATFAPEPLPNCPGFDPDYAEFLVFLNVTKGRMGRKNEEETVSIPTAKVLRWLWKECIDENDWYTASKHRLGQELQMVHTTVSRCIRRLAEWGFLEQKIQGATKCRLIRSVVEPELIKAGYRPQGCGLINASSGAGLPERQSTPRMDIGLLAAEVGSATAAVFLAKAVEFQIRAGDDWWSMTRHDWTRETGLSGREQFTARKKLRKAGFLLEERRGMPAKLWYRLDGEALKRLGNRIIGITDDTSQVWH